MFAKVKSPVFIDTVKFQITDRECCFSALLRDEDGSICSTIETNPPYDREELVWNGLSTLPYGVYTLELKQGDEEMVMQMIKRV